jgi:hypothetical protein
MIHDRHLAIAISVIPFPEETGPHIDLFRKDFFLFFYVPCTPVEVLKLMLDPERMLGAFKSSSG